MEELQLFYNFLTIYIINNQINNPNRMCLLSINIFCHHLQELIVVPDVIIVFVSVCRTEEQAQQFAVPSYEEAVGSGQYPVTQHNPRPSTCQLPSYEDLVQVDSVQMESEVSEATAAPPAAASASGRRPGKNTRKLLPIKIRRIKSEKLRMKNGESAPPAPGISIEPLTPPPQYDKIPPI